MVQQSARCFVSRVFLRREVPGNEGKIQVTKWSSNLFDRFFCCRRVTWLIFGTRIESYFLTLEFLCYVFGALKSLGIHLQVADKSIWVNEPLCFCLRFQACLSLKKLKVENLADSKCKSSKAATAPARVARGTVSAKKRKPPKKRMGFDTS